MRIISSLCIAFSTYSKIPMPNVEWNDENKAYSLCFFPLIGLVVGVLLGGWLWLCDFFAFGMLLRGVIGTAIPLLVTGGIHMDGFMDTCDAIASWQTKERRLEILKDPHTGAFAVINCCLYLLVMSAVLSEVAFDAWTSIGMCFAVSRALSALTLTHWRKAKDTGMLAGFARSAAQKSVTISSGVFVLAAVIVWIIQLGFRGLFPLLAAGLCILFYRNKAYKYFGGVTGDLAGWFTQITELACIAAIMLGGKL
ncbi:MAG: adenosylcobinamide-GDP ribazoletransferase [Clostridiales bacterium]|nr:adenosylcobinamide-GDP ribazoletransferase [Clostridiales bacterium]